MDALNIAIVGYGNIAKTHALAMSAANLRYDLPFILRLSHVVTARKDAVFVPGATVYANLEEAFATGDDAIDIVDICGYNNTHLGVIETALGYKKALYCEKPLAGMLTEAKRAVDLTEAAGIKTGVPLVFRYLPCLRMLKDELAKNTLGAVIEWHAVYYHKSYLSPQKRQSWRTAPSAGGGALLDLGIHMLDAVRVVFGPVADITHRKRIHFEGVAVDETAASDVTMQSGVRGTLTCSRVFAQREQALQLAVFCENGSFLCDFTRPYTLEINGFDGHTVYARPKPDDSFARYYAAESVALNFHMDAHIACLVDFARKVYDGSDSGFGADFREAYLSQMLTQTDGAVNA